MDLQLVCTGYRRCNFRAEFRPQGFLGNGVSVNILYGTCLGISQPYPDAVILELICGEGHIAIIQIECSIRHRIFGKPVSLHGDLAVNGIDQTIQAAA